MDHFNAILPTLHSFVLPGGSSLNIWLHKARTICRKAERRCVKLSKTSNLAETLKFYRLNENAQIPVFSTKQSACFDLNAI